MTRERPNPSQQITATPIQPSQQAVSALGRLTPEGDVRRLAAPSGPMGAMPRVSELMVDVGDQVVQGQLLARFDNQADAKADLNVAQATIASLERREQLLQGDVDRYLGLQELGAISLEGLERRQLKLLAVQQELQLARAELARQQNRFCPAPGVSTLAPTPPCARVRESCRACACMHARMRFPGAQDCRA